MPRAAGVLSALGLAAAERRRDEARTVLLRGDALTDQALRSSPATPTRSPGTLATPASRTSSRCATSRRCATVLREAFAAAHEERYGYRDDGTEVELGDGPHRPRGARPRGRVGDRATQDDAITGPIVVALPEATLVVPAGWRGRTDATGTVILERG